MRLMPGIWYVWYVRWFTFIFVWGVLVCSFFVCMFYFTARDLPPLLCCVWAFVVYYCTYLLIFRSSDHNCSQLVWRCSSLTRWPVYDSNRRLYEHSWYLASAATATKHRSYQLYYRTEVFSTILWSWWPPCSRLPSWHVKRALRYKFMWQTAAAFDACAVVVFAHRVCVCFYFTPLVLAVIPVLVCVCFATLVFARGGPCARVCFPPLVLCYPLWWGCQADVPWSKANITTAIQNSTILRPAYPYRRSVSWRIPSST